METANVVVPREEALRLYREYKKHAHWSKPIDHEIQRAYQAIAKGRMVIKAMESIRLAGVNAEGLPKLAICRADAESCTVSLGSDGSAVMRDSLVQTRTRRRWETGSWEIIQSKSVFTFPAGSFPKPPQNRSWRAQGLVPPAPLHLRPKRGLQNYHILWEAIWTKAVPHDPMLLRRLGKADLWLVVAAWDLTEVERAALSTRL